MTTYDVISSIKPLETFITFANQDCYLCLRMDENRLG